MKWSRTILVSLLFAMALLTPPTRVVGATDEAALPFVLYGTGEELGGHFPLAEIIHGEIDPVGPRVVEAITLRTEMTVSHDSIAFRDLDPKRHPVLLWQDDGSEPLSPDEEGALRRYLEAGGFLVALPVTDEGMQHVRDWARQAFPNSPLMEVSYDHLAQTDDALPPSLRSVSGVVVGVDGLRVDGEIRLLLPRRLRPSSRGFLEFVTSASLIGGLRSPFVKRILASPIDIDATREGESVLIRATVRDFVQGTRLRVTLIDMDGQQIRAQTMKRQTANTELALEFSADVATVPFNPRDYWVRAEWEGIVPLRRTVNLAELLGALETELTGQAQWNAGSPASVRIIARDATSREPLEGATIRAAVRQGETVLAEVEATTNAGGTADLRFDLPAEASGEATLAVDVISPLGDDRIEEPIEIREARKILLTTDKPLYQPGQLMHLRSVSLRVGDLRAVEGGTVTFEVEDSKGNKVFKRVVRRNEFGIASTEFLLADELNLGTYTVRVVDGEWTQEKTVTVKRYVLPKFKIAVDFDREDYRPGDTVEGTVQVDYFFGKPVARGTVEIEASKFDVGWDRFARIKGRTDENGLYRFEIDLPMFFAGLPLERGDSFVAFEITVTDTADHAETIRATRPVVGSPFLVVLVPESGDLVPGVENEVYAVVTTPRGEPVRATVTADFGAGPLEADTDALGVATFRIVPKEADVAATLRVRDRQGQEVERTIHLAAGRETILLRPDRALLRVGEPLGLTVHATQERGWVYVDVIRNGQTIRTTSVTLENHRGTATIAIGPNDFGTLELHAYLLGKDGQIRRDTRLVYVEPADDLKIRIAPDKDTYRPGEDATIRFHVENGEGHPVLAAIGVQIVDESVFALQEMQPGLEKVFFLLEEELLKPKVEVHGFEPGLIVRPEPVPESPDATEARRESAAKVLFAAAEELRADYTLSVRTGERKEEAFRKALAERMKPIITRIDELIMELAERRGNGLFLDASDWVEVLLSEGVLRPEEAVDPWGNPLVSSRQALGSPGPDGKLDTSDDIWAAVGTGLFGVPREISVAQIHVGRGGAEELRLGFPLAGGIGFVQEGMPMVAEEMAMPMAAVGAGPERRMILRAQEAPAVEAKSMRIEVTNGAAPKPEPSVAPTRVREFFPETLLVAPSLLTDENGEATLTFPTADSITTWRVTALASSKGGLLGSNTGSVRVFQDFFVDLDLPLSLTVGDEVSVPVALYNYLEEEQTITLELTREDWFELLDEPTARKTLAPNEVTVHYFRVRATKPGVFSFTVRAVGTKMGDAVRRRIEIVPNGREVRLTLNDRLAGTVERAILIPPEAVPDVSKIFIKLYPGAFSQVVEGLDAILQMPFGCFEQTSSATYPNILALDYMRRTNQNTPEVQMKAMQYIGLGYQRLLSFEVPGGGFEWFGNAPANKVLTAYGLMEFYDMSRVYEVDPNVIQRTQGWLLSQQNPDGSWSPDPAYLHAESWGRIQKNALLPTAYILWALAESGIGPNALDQGLRYLKENWEAAEDPYMLALIANAFLASVPDDPTTASVLERLRAGVVEDDETAYWRSNLSTMTHARGDSSNLETTGLAAIALLKWGKDPQLATKVLTYLIRSKDDRGTWYTTQATILALKALLLGAEGVGETDATIAVFLDGDRVETVRITPEDSEVVRLVDLGRVAAGEHRIRFDMTGKGGPLYQIVARYYVPWDVAVPAEEQESALRVSVEYDRTRLVKDELVTATCTIVNEAPRAAKMVLVDLGIPPGFAVTPSDFEDLVSKGVLRKFQLTGRQVVLYFEEIGAGQRIDLSYTLRAKYPIRAKTRPTKAYAYYNPKEVAFAAPTEIEVTEE